MYKRILIPVDGSSCSAQAVAKGVDLAAALGSEVTFVHAAEDPLELAAEAAPYAAQLYADLVEQGRSILAEALERATITGVRATTRLIEHSRAVHAILEAEEGHDLVVMGTHGRRGFNRWMFGSVAEGVLRRTGIPCLLIRSEHEAAGEELEAPAESRANRGAANGLDEALAETFPASDPIAVSRDRSADRDAR